jgi:hypothetical protein
VLAHTSALGCLRLDDDGRAGRSPKAPPLSLSSGHIRPQAIPYEPEGGTFTWYEGGSVARVRVFPSVGKPRVLGEYGPELVPGMAPHSDSGQYWHRRTRGVIGGFSRHSRRRLLQLVNEIDYADLGYMPKFLTLTYPEAYPESPAVVMKHLAALRRAFERKYGKFPAPWRKELQRRGAPHFHLLLFLEAKVSLLWLRRTWYRIVASGDAKHFKQGVHITRCKNVRQVRSYVSKYMAKTTVDSLSPGESTGRWWGVWNKALLPRHKATVALSAKQRFAARRVIGKYMAKHGAKSVSTGRQVRDGRPAICQPERVGMSTFLPAGDARRYAEFLVGKLPHRERESRGKVPAEMRC